MTAPKQKAAAVKTKAPETEVVIPEVVPDFDPVGMPDRITVLESTKLARRPAQALVAAARKAEVRNEAEQTAAVDILASIKERYDEIDARRKELSAPFDKAAKAINACFRPFLDVLAGAEKTLKEKWGTYVAAEKVRQEAALEAQREEERKVAEAAEAAGTPITIRPRPAPPEVRTHVVTSAGRATTKFEPDYEVVDLKAVFAAYPNLFDLSRQRTLALIRSGVREIPGLKVVDRPNVAVGGRR